MILIVFLIQFDSSLQIFQMHLHDTRNFQHFDVNMFYHWRFPLDKNKKTTQLTL